MSGWIKLHRQFENWEWRDKPEMVSLFIHMLTQANHEKTKWHGIELERGQCIFGRVKWAETLGISEQVLRSSIIKLKSTSEITIKSTNKFSVITIVKYDEYNSSEEKSTSEITSTSTSNQPATNQQLTTPKEDKNIRKDNTPLPPLLESMSFPDWVPDNFQAFLDLRKSLKAKNTDLAVKSLLKMLKICIDKGYVASEIVENSIRNSWKDIYLPKVPPGQADPTKPLGEQLKRMGQGWKD